MPTVRPHDVHRIPATALLRLMPHGGVCDLDAIRSAWANHTISSQRRGISFASWQAAWNNFSHAEPSRPGLIEITATICPDCRGRGFETRHAARNLARTGSPIVCGTCQGNRGRSHAVRLVALHATEPDADTSTATGVSGRQR